MEGHALPAVQVVQVWADPTAYDPALQGLIVATVVLGQAKPGGQGVHDVALPRAYDPSEQATGLRVESDERRRHERLGGANQADWHTDTALHSLVRDVSAGTPSRTRGASN